ncbi:MAG: heparan-alpha-glucosaminide N-acetyltransferase domain-containing protein [Gemmiger sp.]|nr:heparan-alpha-glucosaminide N-acetyltransferase domain-containing protein [Gemmiger sp.]
MPNPTPRRLWQLDALRGAALIHMLAYHALYDWVYVFGHQSSWYDISAPGPHIWQQYICWSFLLISGYSVALSKKPLKNGLVTGACALLLTVVTVVALPQERILFGILHLNACALLLTVLLRPLLERLPPAAGLAGAAVLFFVTNQLPAGYLGFEGLHLFTLPAGLYRANWFWLGLPDLTRFYSADYFPLIPWLFLFWCGYFAYRCLPHRPPTTTAPKAPALLHPLCAVGSRTLLVYMLHQPVIYGVLWLAHSLGGKV